jgi:arginase
VGMIWIDSKPNYHTFETTVNGNIHDLPLAAINGYKNGELRYYYDGKIIQPSKTVIIGCRHIDEGEKDNVRYSGVTVFTTEDIKTKGVQAVMEEAFKIAGYKTKGIHVSYDLSVIDPEFAPGVSIPEFDGITEDEAMEINEYIVKNIKDILSFDLVEFNPLRDIDRKTEQIALNILAQIIKAAENKKKFEQKTYY